MSLRLRGAPAAIKLTPTVGPQGLQAEGQDAALIDFGGRRRRPTLPD